MEEESSYETSVANRQSTQHLIPDVCNPNCHIFLSVGVLQ